MANSTRCGSRNASPRNVTTLNFSTLWVENEAVRAHPLLIRLALASSLATFGCRSPEPESKTDAQIHVLAASSLKNVLDDIAASLESTAGIEVRISYAGSQELAAQILAGAPADVFVSAGRKHMDRVVKGGLATESSVKEIARNRVAILFRKDIRPPVKSVADLSRRDLRIVIGAEDVPVGAAGRQLLDKLEGTAGWERAAFDRNVRSHELSDLALVSKLRLGEADVAVAYRSDLSREDALAEIPLPEGVSVEIVYYATILNRSKNVESAGLFLTAMEDAGPGNSTMSEGGLLPAR
jgi:molybdate transport system substrate-binding protein